MIREKDRTLAKRQKQQETRQADLRSGRIRIAIPHEEEMLEESSRHEATQEHMRKVQKTSPKKGR